MKIQKLLIPFLILLFIFSGSYDAEAQRRRKKKRRRPAKKERVKKDNRAEKDEDIIAFKDRLWYGVNANLNLSNSFFVLGLNPMVGYKFNDWLSVGPELIFDYVQWKEILGNDYTNIKVLDYGIGVFTRAKFLEQFFFHAEYSLLNKGTALLDPTDSNKYVVDRELKAGAFLGLGYTTSDSYTWGYQATLLYNLYDDPRSSSIPISIKVGLAYNF